MNHHQLNSIVKQDRNVFCKSKALRSVNRQHQILLTVFFLGYQHLNIYNGIDERASVVLNYSFRLSTEKYDYFRITFLSADFL